MDERDTEARRIQRVWLYDDDRPYERPTTARDRWIGVAIILGVFAFGALQRCAQLAH